MKSKIKRALRNLSPYVKYLSLLLYCIAADILWPRRNLLPVPALLGDFTRDAIVFSVLFAVFVCLFDLLRRPWGIAKRAQETFATAGLTNARGEIPVLRSIRADKDKPHGKILVVKHRGISITDFDQKVHRLEAGLGSKIYNMEYGRGAKTTRLYLLPMKYIHPTVINPTDEALGSLHVSRLINLLVVGGTGTGKTVAIKTTLGMIARHQPNPTFWILDFKQMDFKAYTHLPHYYACADCAQGLEDYYAAFQAAQASGVAGNPQYLICDEWGFFINRMGRKADHYKELLADVLAAGRAYCFIPIIGIQRSDASYFVGGARDNFSARLALGNLSREGRHMVFLDDDEKQITRCRKREGHLSIDGMGPEKVKMAEIADLDALDTSILAAISTPPATGGSGGEAEREPADPPAAKGG